MSLSKIPGSQNNSISSIIDNPRASEHSADAREDKDDEDNL